MNDLPIACTLPVDERQRRRSDLLPGLIARAESHEPLPNGARLRFAASTDTLQIITRVIDAERQCCQFFRFQLVVEPGLGPLVLDVEGPAGTSDFLAELLASRSATPPEQSSSK